MQLKLIHGRKNADDELENWGFDGATLKGIKYMHVTYFYDYFIGFKDMESRKIAQAETGWEEFDDCTLLMRVKDDMVETKEGFFGDWELQEEI